MSKNVAALAVAALTIAPYSVALAADDSDTAIPAADPPAPAPTGPLSRWGLTANGYASASYYHSDGYPSNIHEFDIRHDSFQLDQAGFSLAYQPKQGFGALVDLVAGQDVRILHASEDGHPSSFDVRQVYAQYATGPLTVIAGKFLTLAGVEFMNPVLDTNFSRSLLYTLSQPIDHTGVRTQLALTGTLNLFAGVNNGWNITSVSFHSTTGEAGAAWTPSKAFSLSTAAYFGKSELLPGTMNAVDANKTLLDVAATYNATSALTFIVNVDWNRQDHAFFLNSRDASWYGAAAYVNYAFNTKWRVSLRGEYFDDQDGFLTSTPGGQHLEEGTVTIGYMPVPHVEVRLEGRYDTAEKNSLFRTAPNAAAGTGPALTDNLEQFALQGLLEF